MGYRDCDEVWALKLRTPQKFVLLAIAKHANDDGFAWPSVKRLVELTSISESSVHRALLKLKEYGLIEVTRRNHNCLYQLNLERKSHTLQPTANLTEPTANLTEPTVNLTVPTVTLTPEYIKEEVKGIDNFEVLATIHNTKIKSTTFGGRENKYERRDYGMRGSSGILPSLYNVWLQEMPKWTDKVVPWSVGEKVAMKSFENALGEKASEVLRMVLHKWDEFGEYLTDNAGAQNPPKAPKVFLIVKYKQEALTFAVASDKPKEQGMPMEQRHPPLPKEAPVVKTGRSATLEEVEAICAELEPIDRVELKALSLNTLRLS